MALVYKVFVAYAVRVEVSPCELDDIFTHFVMTCDYGLPVILVMRQDVQKRDEINHRTLGGGYGG